MRGESGLGLDFILEDKDYRCSGLKMFAVCPADVTDKQSTLLS